MKRIAIIIAASFVVLQASAQFSFEVNGGLGQYKLSDLKTYQNAIRGRSFPMNSVITDNFPAYWNYGANMRWTANTMQFGFAASAGSTGGQVYYSDYSGYRKEKNTFYYTSLAVIVAKRFDISDKFDVSADLRPGVSLGGLRSVQSTRLYDSNAGQEITNHAWRTAINFSIEPTITATYHLGIFGISAFAGYHYDLRNDEFNSSVHGYLQSNPGHKPNVRMDITGFRVGGSVGIYLKKKEGDEKDFSRFYVGPGLGLDYGGMGVNLTVMATRHLGFYAGVGYNLKGAGFNGGARVYVVGTENRLRPFFSAMYGYNAVLIVKNNHFFDKVTYGPTGGFGIDVKASRKNYWTAAFYVPVRDQEMTQHISYLKANGFKAERDLLPFAISLGYRFGL